MNDISNKKVKIMMLGETCNLFNLAVGKSCLLFRFSDNEFREMTTTLGVDFRKKKLNIKGMSVDVQVWDTAGQERFRNITPVYYKNVHGVILVYDITCHKSFENIEYWMGTIKEHGNPDV